MSSPYAGEVSVNPVQRRPVGHTTVEVTAVGFGAAPLGGLYAAVDDAEARAAVAAALQAGIGYFDVAPLYGFGLAEERVGDVLRGVARESYTLSTKVGRLVRDADRAAADMQYVGVAGKRAEFDYSRDGVLRSLDTSMDRLGVDRIDIVYIHDPDNHYEAAVDTAYPTLAELRDEGVIGAVGVGMNQVEMLSRFVAETDIDVVLCAGRYSLLDQSAAHRLLPLCLARGVSVVIGGVFNSGLLADPYADNLYYDYRPAPASTVARARALARTCAAHGTPLRAAALQFPLRHEAVTSVLTGVRSGEELADNLEMVTFPAPPGLWAELSDAAPGEGT